MSNLEVSIDCVSRPWFGKNRECVNNAIDQLGKVFQRFENRLVWKRRVLAERYSEGTVKLLAEFDVYCGGQLHKYHAIFDRAEPQVIDHDRSSTWEPHIDSMYSDKLGCWNEGIVFIGNVEVVDGPQRVVPSFVRLQRADYLDDIFSGSIYVSALNGILKSVCPSREGEVDIFGFAPIHSHKITGEMIESGAEVMDCIPDNTREILRHLLPDPERPEVMRGVRILLDNDLIRITTDVGSDPVIQFSDVALRPINL